MEYSCSTKKNTFLRRFYHGTSTHYNGYFNARELVRSAEYKIHYDEKDDYTTLLPIHKYGSESFATGLAEEMDKAIAKCSEAIDRHSIYKKRKEHNPWVDDCYLLIGKARFYKQEYFLAIEMFEYVAKAFKKEPIKFDALMWLSRAHMQVKDEEKAESYLKLIAEDVAPPKKIQGEYNALLADFYMRTKQYEKATEHLEKALTHTKKKKLRRRYNYVLAQLYLKELKYERASRYFTEVIRLKPPVYDMMFNAQINRALSVENNDSDKEQIKKKLHKMLKDGKNKEYKDQIYYALADIAFKESNENLGISYLNKSIRSSTSNKRQKSLSYLKLGDLYYTAPKYRNAKLYYDSCLTNLSKDHERFEILSDRRNSLNDLVKNIETIQLQDSLLRLAEDESYRDKIIAELIKKEEEAAKKKEEESETPSQDDNSNADFQNNGNSFTNSSSNKSNTNWYFYNPTTLSFGFSDFKQRWGDRKLEDNWRRSQKQNVMAFDEEKETKEAGPKSSSEKITASEKTSKEFYLKQIPSSQAQKEAAVYKKTKALYENGNIFRESLLNYKFAISSFEEIINNYDTSSYKLPSWYNIYRIALLIEDDALEKKYQDLIIDNYPDSEYARIIQDPTYNKTTRETKKRVDNYYNNVYKLYKKGSYQKVKVRCETAKTIFADNHLQHRFDFISALSVGKTAGFDSLKIMLNQVIKTHPNSDITPRAKEIIALIDKGPSKLNIPKEVPVYESKHTEPHVMAFIVPVEDKNNAKYKARLSDFCTMYFKKSNLKTSVMPLDVKNQMLIVKSFENQLQAENFIEKFNIENQTTVLLKKNNLQAIYFSNPNFLTFLGRKNIDEYLTFYNKDNKKEVQ